MSTPGRNPDPPLVTADDYVREVLEARARNRDHALNEKLLHDLVFRYAAVERELAEKQRLLDEDLTAAARVQRALLPSAAPALPGWEFAWKFVPCEHIGGDIFNLTALTADCCAAYIIDVSGHGVPAALVTASLAQFLQPSAGNVVRDGQPVLPADLLFALNNEFPQERFDRLASIAYCLLAAGGVVRYGNAGHPPPVLARGDQPAEQLALGGTMLGIFPDSDYGTITLHLQPGDTLLSYTDGIIEFNNAQDELFGEPRLLTTTDRHRGKPLPALLDGLYADLMAFSGGAAATDDISLLACRYTG